MHYAFDGRTPETGKETYVSEHALVIGDVTIGDNCYIGPGAILRGDYGSIVVRSGTAVEEGVIVHAPPGGTSEIGERVIVGHGALVHSASIGRGSVIGMGAILSIRSEIGANTIIAEGSVVRMSQVIPGDVVAGGNPAKVVRKTAPKDVEFWTGAQELYIRLARQYLAGGLEPLF